MASSAAISLIKNPQVSGRNKHIDLKMHHVQDLVNSAILRLTQCVNELLQCSQRNCLSQNFSYTVTARTAYWIECKQGHKTPHGRFLKDASYFNANLYALIHFFCLCFVFVIASLQTLSWDAYHIFIPFGFSGRCRSLWSLLVQDLYCV